MPGLRGERIQRTISQAILRLTCRQQTFVLQQAGETQHSKTTARSLQYLPA
jgi:hypothetical protein